MGCPGLLGHLFRGDLLAVPHLSAPRVMCVDWDAFMVREAVLADQDPRYAMI